MNDEASQQFDPIQTPDGADYKTNEGFILGLPFLRAFMFSLDTQQNRIGFANKIHNLGASIHGEGAPGPIFPYDDEPDK